MTFWGELMKRTKKALSVAFFSSAFVFITTSYNNCGQLIGVDKSVKFSYLAANQVFDEGVRDMDSGATWLDGESFDDGMAQYHQMDDGAGGSNQNDNGSGGSNQNDNGNGSNNNNDNGNGGTGTTDGGQTLVDKFDDDDSGNNGITVPTPTNPDALGDKLNSPTAIANVRNCRQENGDPGFQFLRVDQKTYSACDICEVIDRVNGRCLIRVRLPDPPPRAIAANGGGDGGGDGGSGDPLIIDVQASTKLNDDGSQLEKLKLSSQANGVMFDLFGRRARPEAYQKVKISWTNNPRYMYLVLPDSHGLVRGIDQMFGDSTLGPDGKYSLDGFQALSKWDGRDARGLKFKSAPDGMITKDDPVYSRLRLWADTNFNGMAEVSELKTLEEVGLVSIDLKYDPNFYEKDVYGNEAIFKSVAVFENEKLGVVFDLWFKPGSSDGGLFKASPSLRGPASAE